MKMILRLTLVLMSSYPLANAQVEPAATGPHGPLVNGDLTYAVRYSQTAILYGNNQSYGGNQVASIASANLNYAHPYLRRPFRLDYEGGYMWTIAGQPLGSGVFQHLLVSQGIVQRRWELAALDSFSYTPEAPTTGFSGIPGTGEPIGGSGTTTPPSQSILTVNTRVLDNFANVEANYKLNYATGLIVSGGSQLLLYPTGNGLSSQGQEISAGVTRRINALSSVSGQYSYSHFSYDASPYSDGVAGNFGANSLSVDYRRIWNRQFSTDIAIGPEWTGGSDQALVPPTSTITVNAAVNYQLRSESATLMYNRGINGSTGYLPGATVDSVTGTFSRTFGKNLTVGATGAYFRTAPLQTAGGATDARFGGAQISQRLGTHFNIFASYTAIDQSSGLSSSTAQANVLSQFYQVVSFGISCSPREVRLRK